MAEPADVTMTDEERKWLEAAFQATGNTKLATKFQLFEVEQRKMFMLVVGNSTLLRIFPDQKSPTHSLEVFGSFMFPADALQTLVNLLAQYGIKAE